jgi:hypothetical protein
MAKQWNPNTDRTPYGMRTHYNREVTRSARPGHKPQLGQMAVALLLGCADELARSSSSPRNVSRVRQAFGI